MLNSDENKLRLDRWSSSLLRGRLGPMWSYWSIHHHKYLRDYLKHHHFNHRPFSHLGTSQYLESSTCMKVVWTGGTPLILYPLCTLIQFWMVKLSQFWDNDSFISWKPLSDLSDWQEAGQMSLKKNEWLCKGFTYLLPPIILSHICQMAKEIWF